MAGITPPDPPEKTLYNTWAARQRNYTPPTFEKLTAEERAVWVAIAQAARDLFSAPPTLKNC